MFMIPAQQVIAIRHANRVRRAANVRRRPAVTEESEESRFRLCES